MLKSFTQWIVARFIKDYQKVTDLKVRARYGGLEGWVSIIGNTLLFLVKIITGLFINSVSLIADAVHTLSDSATSVVVIIGFKMAKKPSDKEHPFGHGRMEFVAALVIAVLLIVVGVELMQRSIHNTLYPSSSVAPIPIIILISATIVLKDLMARFAYRLSEIIDSKALKADALHHKSDVFATALVVMALVASRFGYHRVDGIMGILVSLIILYSGYSIAKESISPLLGEAPSKQSIKEIEKIARSHKGTLGIHDIIFNKYGQTNVISLHIEVSDKESPHELHALSEAIEEEIAKRFGGMVIAHIDPINKDHPQYGAIEKAIKEIILEDRRICNFHELRIVGLDSNKCNVIFDIALEEDVDEQDSHDIISAVKRRFKSKFPGLKAVIKAEPKYVYNL